MMELISKVSKGSRMDQIYIPKVRQGFDIGTYVIIKQLRESEIKPSEKPFFYNINYLEPIKVKVINELFSSIPHMVDNYDNIIITGSFLEEGFNFNDIDVILITEDGVDIKHIEKTMETKIGVKTHIIHLNTKSLLDGLSTDPLYQMMLSKCVSSKRFVYRVEHKIDYKVLDLHLLKSKVLIENFDVLDGNEKYYLTRNMVAIVLYLQHKKINKDVVDKEIQKVFNIDIKEIKQNMPEKDRFLEKYKNIYKKTFNKIMEGITSGSKQE